MRLRDLREDNDLKQYQIAKLLNIKQNTYSQYENEKREIPIDLLWKLADFYKTSIDYIVGRTNKKWLSLGQSFLFCILHLFSCFVLFVGVDFGLPLWREPIRIVLVVLIVPNLWVVDFFILHSVGIWLNLAVNLNAEDDELKVFHKLGVYIYAQIIIGI